MRKGIYDSLPGVNIMFEICERCGGAFFMADTDDAQNRWYKKCVHCGHRQRELTSRDSE